MAVAVLAEELSLGAGPRAGLTITGLLVGTSVVNVWRTADGIRKRMRGYRRAEMNQGAFITDYDVPTNRPVTWEVEVLSGPGGPVRAISNSLTIADDGSWIMDPFVPQSAIKVLGERRDGNSIYLRSPALEALEYAADNSLFDIMRGEPVALFGERMAARGMDLSMAVRSAEQNTRLKKLLLSSGGFLFRPGPELAGLDLPGTMFVKMDKVVQRPVDSLWGGQATWWDMVADTVAAPTLRVLTATFTYADVQAMWTTYAQKQTAMAGKTYLDDLKNPLG